MSKKCLGLQHTYPHVFPVRQNVNKLWVCGKALQRNLQRMTRRAAWGPVLILTWEMGQLGKRREGTKAQIAPCGVQDQGCEVCIEWTRP